MTRAAVLADALYTVLLGAAIVGTLTCVVSSPRTKPTEDPPATSGGSGSAPPSNDDGRLSFHEDFEQAKMVVDLFPLDFSRWGDFEIGVHTSGEPQRHTKENLVNGMDGNRITVTSQRAHGGKQSAQFVAVPSLNGKRVSKASIHALKFGYRGGTTVSVSAWFYLQGTDSAEGLFLLDVEDSHHRYGGAPGVRLILVGTATDNFLAIERRKFGLDSNHQPPALQVPFPRDRWVHLRWDLKLSDRKDGEAMLWQDERKIISEKEITLPPGGHYDWFEFGITANTRRARTTLYLDDIDIAPTAPAPKPPARGLVGRASFVRRGRQHRLEPVRQEASHESMAGRVPVRPVQRTPVLQPVLPEGGLEAEMLYPLSPAEPLERLLEEERVEARRPGLQRLFVLRLPAGTVHRDQQEAARSDDPGDLADESPVELEGAHITRVGRGGAETQVADQEQRAIVPARALPRHRVVTFGQQRNERRVGLERIDETPRAERA